MTDTTPSSRIVAFVAAIAVVLATLFVPAGAALADGEIGEESPLGLWINGVEVTTTNRSGDGWEFDDDGVSKTLTLKDFSGSTLGDRDAVIDYTGTDELNLVFEGNNTILGIKSGEENAGTDIKSSAGRITINGEGTLVVAGGEQAIGGGSVFIANGLFVEAGDTSDELKPVEELYPSDMDNEYETSERCLRFSSERRYAVTVKDSADGTVTATPMRALAGEEVQLTASPKTGFRFLGFVARDSNDSLVEVETTGSNSSFTMPKDDVEVSAIFAQINKVIVKESTGGSVTTDKSEAVEGETVTVTAKPAGGYAIGSISIQDSSKTEVPVSANATHDKFNFVTPASDVTVTVTFKEVTPVATTHTVTVGKLTNGSIKITNGANKESSTSKLAAEKDDKITLEGVPADGYRLKAGSFVLSYGDNKTQQLKSNAFLMPSYDVTVTAEFEKMPTYTVKAMAAGKGKGTFSIKPSSGVEGTKVTLEATPASGSIFSGWTIAKGEGAKLDGNTLTIGTSDVELTATFDVDEATDPSAIKSPVPKMATSRGGTLTSVSTTVAYRILQEVPADATYVGITFDLEPVMEYTSSASQVSVVISGTTTAINAAKVNIDGQRLTVVVDDASAVEALRGKRISVTFSAKIKDGANLSSYLNSAGNVASVPYKATTVFKGTKDRTVQSTTEYVKFSVGSSGGSSGSGSSSSGSTAKSATTTKAKETLAATGDPTSAGSLVCMAVAGGGVTLAGLRRKHAA